MRKKITAINCNMNLRKKSFSKLFILYLSLISMGMYAQTISVTKTNPGGSADNSGNNIFDAPGSPGCFSVIFNDNDFPGGNYVVTDIRVRTVFTKEPGAVCGDGASNGQNPFLNEIGLGFQKDGTQITLIGFGDYASGGAGPQTGDYTFAASTTAGCPINSPAVIPTGGTVLPPAGTYSPVAGNFLDLRGSDACAEYSFCFKDDVAQDPLCVSLVEVTVEAEAIDVDCIGFIGPFCEGDISAAGPIELNDYITASQTQTIGPDVDCDGVATIIPLQWEWFIAVSYTHLTLPTNGCV